MGSKRNRDRRCKRSNNWKVIKKMRDEKNKILNSSNTECTVSPDSIETPDNHELRELDTIRVEAPQFSEHQRINDQAKPNISVKRRRMTSPRDSMIILPEAENYFALLSETDVEDGQADIPFNDLNSYKCQSVGPLFIDPLDSDYEGDVSDHGDGDISGEEDNTDAEDDEDIADAPDVHNTEEDVANTVVEEDDVENTAAGDDVDNDTDEGDNVASGDKDEEEYLIGRRLFAVSDLFQRIKKIGNHSKNCNFNDMVLIGEVKKGLNSTFKFKCEKCGVKRKLESNPKKPNSLNCNEEAVLGINAIGSGFYHLEEFCANLNVPCMGGTLYDSISKNQQSDWFLLAKQSALDALKEEIALAIAANDVDELGRALLAVICDGGWGKRSYGKKFNSLSGCAVLIGVRTKKVVFFGVRNKYCHTCKIAQSKTTPVKEHDCNINYTGPSSGMEADIILEGFKESEQYGARYYKLISDGDSNTYKTLRDFRVYKDPDIVIEKLECVNHLCRNFRSKFRCLETITKFNPTLRKHVKPSKGNSICKGVKVAAKHWRESNLSLREQIRNLESDIMNAPSHYFGVHTHCKSYFCTKSTEKASLDNLKLLKDDGLYYEVMNICQVYFAGNAKSLLENHTNNAAEYFNNIVAKYLGGKRINFSLAGSYSSRVSCGVVHYNSGGHAGTEFRNFKLGNEQESSTNKLELGRKRKLMANEAALTAKPRHRHQKEGSATGSYFHREGFEDLDMEPEKYQKCKEIFLNKIQSRKNIWKRIEAKTVDKKFDSYWHEIRQDLLPSSHFHTIIKAMKPESYTKILKEIMYNRSEFGNNAQIKHQRLVEGDALATFENLYVGEIITECGIFIDQKVPFLCASPFRLVGKNSILSIKCPLKEYNKDFNRVIDKIKFFKRKDGDISINEKSDWFIELQGDMHVTGRQHAHLMIWLGNSSYRVIELDKIDNFFDKNLKSKLTYFYMEVMLKELVDPRVKRRMALRTYNAEKSSFL